MRTAQSNIGLHLREFLDDVGARIRVLIGERIDLAIVTGPGLGPVRADEEQLAQAILSLANTASDAMPHGGRFTIETRNGSPGSDDTSRRVREMLDHAASEAV